MPKKAGGFSLIEILLVLALMGMVSSLCVIHFDALQDLFAGDSRCLSILNNAIQEGRLWCTQNHKSAVLECKDNAIHLMDASGKEVKTFAFSKAQANALRLTLLPGKLDANGILRPNTGEMSGTCFKIDANGFFQSIFIEIELDEDREQYALDILTGELQSTHW